MTDLLAAWWVHTVAIERKTGASSYGDVYAASETARGFVSDDDHLVLNGDGEQVVASTRVALAPTVTPVPVGSRVTLPAAFASRVTVVIAASVGDAGGLPLPSHHEISLR